MIFGKKDEKPSEPALPKSSLRLEDVKKAVLASSGESEEPLELPSSPPPEDLFPGPVPVKKEEPAALKPSPKPAPRQVAKPAADETEKEIRVPDVAAPKRRSLPLPPAPEGMEPKPGDVLIDIPSRPPARKVTGGVLIKADEPELLRALVDLVNKDSTVQVISALDNKELSVSEMIADTKLDEAEVKGVMHRLVCLNLVKGFWYKSPSGNHVRKYKFETTKGLLEFDLSLLKETLSIEDLKSKSTRLVALVTTEGRLPRSLLIKALPVMGDRQLDQVLRYTERFKLPNIRELITEEARLTADPKGPSVPEEISTEKKPPEIKDLYDEIATIERSLSEVD